MADDGPNRESFEALLTWLDPDRDKAWEKYQAIWDRLVKIFTWRHCRNVEENERLTEMMIGTEAADRAR